MGRYAPMFGAAVAGVWTISAIASVYAGLTGGSYSTPESLHGLMGIVVGAACGRFVFVRASDPEQGQ